MAKSKGEAKLPESVEEWYKNFGSTRQKVTKLHFYFQDVMGGPNPTVLKVIESKTNSATSFGQLSMLDDLVTEGPEPDSKKVGRAQGSIGFADLNDTALQMVLNIMFTEGEYAGSSISILGRNQIFQEYRELPIVGGTGVFRLARGTVVTNTYSFDTTTNKGVLEYTLFVVHYEDCT
ncbi:Dirigent protein 1 [Abeliophyllum distichum]|uniref:Dirigent protein n=1 Tax=Abeliophyllum distichum TaxID=126358 RepID=A0ABD1RS90_9LAMI